MLRLALLSAKVLGYFVVEELLLSLFRGDSRDDIWERIVDDGNGIDRDGVERSLGIGLQFDIVQREKIEKSIVDDSLQKSVRMIQCREREERTANRVLTWFSSGVSARVKKN